MQIHLNMQNDDKIFNPATGRYVSKTGQIGRRLVANAQTRTSSKRKIEPIVINSSSSSNSSRRRPKNSKFDIVEQLKNDCNNQSDPISMEDFADLDIDRLKSVVKIGKGPKKNCYLLENIHGVYKTAVMSNKLAKDPMDPSHDLTLEEITQIKRKMKETNARYESPKYESPRPYPRPFELSIQLLPALNMFHITIKHNARVQYDLGYIPAWIESNHTGSTDHTSAVVMANIQSLWDRSLLTDDIQRRGFVPQLLLGKNVTYWQNQPHHVWVPRFVQLSQSVSNLLNN